MSVSPLLANMIFLCKFLLENTNVHATLLIDLYEDIPVQRYSSAASGLLLGFSVLLLVALSCFCAAPASSLTRPRQPGPGFLAIPYLRLIKN